MITAVTNPADPHRPHGQRPAPQLTELDYVSIQRSAEFAALRRSLRRFVFPMSALFFGWYLCYVLLAAYAHDLMSHRLTGHVTVGLVMGVLQFVSTVLIMVAYVRFAGRRIDPQVAALRARYGRRDADERGVIGR